MLAFTGMETCNMLRDLVRYIGFRCLWITLEEVVMHLVRASFAMALILGGMLEFEVIPLGRWTSDSFIWYMREQILEFSEHIYRNMIRWDKFFTVLRHTTLQAWSQDAIQASHSLQLCNSCSIQPKKHDFG